MKKEDIRSNTECNGLRARVKREVFAAAVTPRSPERDASLAYWHERQRNMERIYYRNRLWKTGYPTKEQRADAREMAAVGNWRDSPEARHEARQLGLTCN